jgi:hypothetical protein
VLSLNFFATGAFTIEVFPAGPTIKTAIGNQLLIVFDFDVHLIPI